MNQCSQLCPDRRCAVGQDVIQLGLLSPATELNTGTGHRDEDRQSPSDRTVIAAERSSLTLHRARDRMPALVLGLAMGLIAFAVSLLARIRAQDCART